jgi:hypothetical protein
LCFTALCVGIARSLFALLTSRSIGRFNLRCVDPYFFQPCCISFGRLGSSGLGARNIRLSARIP